MIRPIEIAPDAGSPALFRAYRRSGISGRRTRMSTHASTSSAVVVAAVWRVNPYRAVLIFPRTVRR